MGFFDRPLFDFSGDGETDFMEWSIGMQMTASSRQEAIDLTGDDAFHSGSDILEEKGDDELEMMDEEEKRETLEEAELDPDDYNEF